MHYSRLFLPLMLAAAIAAAACDEPNAPRFRCAEPTPLQGIVTFTWDVRPEDTMRVLVTDAATIADACEYLATGVGSRMPTGTIVRGAGSDPALPFHYIPETVRLRDAGIEICDGRLMKTPAALDEYMEGVVGDRNAAEAPYCPWGAYPVRVD